MELTTRTKKERLLFKILIFLFTVFSVPTSTAAQVKDVIVEKVPCRHDLDKIDGYKLVISVHLADTVLKTPADFYDLDAVAKLPDSIKLVIVSKLLEFKGDTSVCCRKVNKYYYEGIERTCIGRPQTRHYSIQIDALYTINKIVHPEGISMYSCFPVVIDWQSKKELNNCPDLIIDYYKVYERCLQEAYSTKLISGSFRFNTRKYAWYGAIEETIAD